MDGPDNPRVSPELPMMQPQGLLVVRLMSAHDLPKTDWVTDTDAYLRCSVCLSALSMLLRYQPLKSGLPVRCPQWTCLHCLLLFNPLSLVAKYDLRPVLLCCMPYQQYLQTVYRQLKCNAVQAEGEGRGRAAQQGNPQHT